MVRDGKVRSGVWLGIGSGCGERGGAEKEEDGVLGEHLGCGFFLLGSRIWILR